MVENERIDMSEGVDVNKTVDLHDYIICHNCYFFKFTDRFQPKVCNGRNGFLQKAVSFNVLQLLLLKSLITGFIFGI